MKICTKYYFGALKIYETFNQTSAPTVLQRIILYITTSILSLKLIQNSDCINPAPNADHFGQFFWSISGKFPFSEVHMKNYPLHDKTVEFLIYHDEIKKLR